MLQGFFALVNAVLRLFLCEFCWGFFTGQLRPAYISLGSCGAPLWLYMAFLWLFCGSSMAFLYFSSARLRFDWFSRSVLGVSHCLQ